MVLATSAFKTEFAVDMTCQSCVSAVKGALQDIPGIERFDIELENKRVTITGKTPPSQLLAALKSTERQVLVRGASSADPSLPSQAAISILESPVPLLSQASRLEPGAAAAAVKELPGMNEDEFSQKVFGIARLVQIAPKSILIDLTVRLPTTPSQAVQDAYRVYVSATGNVVDPPRTTGASWLDLGKVTPDRQGFADLFREVDGELWEWIGRACVVEREGAAKENEEGGVFAGVVARSAGAWGNEKTVCACSGRTMWEEGREMDAKM